MVVDTTVLKEESAHYCYFQPNTDKNPVSNLMQSFQAMAQTIIMSNKTNNVRIT